MKITKSKLRSLIKEEIKKFKLSEAFMGETSSDDDYNDVFALHGGITFFDDSDLRSFIADVVDKFSELQQQTSKIDWREIYEVEKLMQSNLFHELQHALNPDMGLDAEEAAEVIRPYIRYYTDLMGSGDYKEFIS